MNILLLFLALAGALTREQTETAKKIMDAQKPPRFVTIQEAALSGGDVAFTTSDLKRVYIDSRSFAKAPKAFANSLIHEVSHVNGMIHGDGRIGSNYNIRKTIGGEIIEDDFVLLPGLV